MSYDALAGRLRREVLFAPAPADRVEISAPEVEAMIPHRPPIRLVDTIEGFDLAGLRTRGAVTVRDTDPVFAGHFPGQPIYPGVLHLEMIGQLGLCLAWMATHGLPVGGNGARPVDARVVKVHHASFLAPVLPGDRLDIVAQGVEWDPLCGVIAGQVLGAGEVIRSTCILEVYFA